MAGYEYVCIVGNVGRDPETREVGDSSVTNFSVAVTNRWKDRNSGEQREKTKWFRVSCWRGLADVTKRYVHKGMQVMVIGTIDTSAYMGKDGEPKASLDLTAQNVQFLSGSRDGQSSDGGNASTEPSYGGDDFAPQVPSDNDDDDIPF